ncbi:MAG: molybdopterin-dependent oxidoreductase [Porticoccaceae bacterium]
MKQVKSFCRMCGSACGTVLTLDDDNHLVKVRPDDANPMSRGYLCYKGLYADEMENSPHRLLHTVKRMPDGDYQPIDTEQALDEIAERMGELIDRYGKDAIALYTGGHSYLTATAWMMLPMFRKALGTNANYSTATIDQSAKFVAVERLGAWAAGKHTIDSSDVLLLIGTNPLVAHSSAGCLTTDPVKTLKRERDRGLKLIVIDPRRTETAAFADIFLQPWPGEDATVVSGLLRIILAEGWLDQAFVEVHVQAGGMTRLWQAVEPFTPAQVADRAGIDADQLYAAARLFATAGRGSAFSGTGPSMAPHANLNEHLIELLNVVCGRYRREGEPVEDIAILLPPRPFTAEVIPPMRGFAAVPPGRIRGAGQLFGERMTSTLADEILTPGAGQVRALFNAGGNPASSFPDQEKTVRALQSLDLLVSIQPFMDTTARLADYVFAPKLQYERADIPMYIYDMSFYPRSWAQYTPEIVSPPTGARLVDDWYVFWGLAKRLGLTLEYNGEALNMVDAPTSDDLLELRCRGSVIPLEELKRYPEGKVYDLKQRVQPAPAGACGRFDVMPDDVFAELQAALADGHRTHNLSRLGFTHQLQVRRVREINNSSAMWVSAVHKRMPYNWAAMNPADLDALRLAPDSQVIIRSEHGSIPAVVRSDDSIRPGVVSMAHCWGGLPGEDGRREPGSNVNLLISTEQYVEPINAMVRMTAIPVAITPA